MQRTTPMPAAPTPADLAACRQLLRGGSKSFHAASLLLPWRTRDDATALYAFCRVSDDLIDQAGGSAEVLALLRERLRLACAGRPMPIPADRALAHVVARHAIPAALPEGLLEGFAWDAAGRHYEDMEALFAYATRVAGTVGAMMTLLMGTREPNTLARAIDLGVAMQLTNIARDVGEDARAGRLYLPRALLRDAGIDPDAWLARPVFTPALAGVVRQVLDAAEILYDRAEAGIAGLPAACRAGIRAARALYREIGREVARNALNPVDQRAVVPTGRKLSVIARNVAPLRVDSGSRADPVLPAARFLLDAVAAQPVPPARAPGFDARADWLVDLFARLERRDHLVAAPSHAALT